MLGISWPKWLKGKIDIECRGNHLIDFINHAVNKGILMENIFWVDEQRLRLTVILSDFFRLVTLLRQHQGRLRIIKKIGAPFWIERIKKRKVFVIGSFLFVILLFVMSSLVWNVEVEGTENIPEQQVRQLLSEQGVFTGQFKRKLPDREQIQYYILSKLPQASWIGMRVEGTRVIVTVVEKKQVDKEDLQYEPPGPVDLVANRDALIYDMRIQQGNPIVEVNEVVKKGQTLVSGKYGDPTQPDSGKIVGAKGKVWGEVWYVSEVEVPLQQKRKVYTGQRKKTKYPLIHTLIIKNPLSNDQPFVQYETEQRIKRLQIAGKELPIGVLEEEYLEMNWVNQPLTQKEAIQLGVVRARDELVNQLGRDGRILEEKVLHQRVDNGKVYLKVHFDAVENIAVPQPILQGE
ncbi:sporulation protein YqfD [Hazenella coriacea]|uniref:Stage IV sporulation protein n=1 Tax=Hazenella coriacea TaxID=1179467 RepID=A0A4R3L4Q8_9BACL|nr:sporulation protein YqfD [Hazenella coriacea]TCS94761.1 hypothetical protein EDD58_103180 [Hazenella coriacea]